MSDVLVYVQGRGDTVVWYVFIVFRARFTVNTVNTGDWNSLIPPRNVPGRKIRKMFKKMFQMLDYCLMMVVLK